MQMEICRMLLPKIMIMFKSLEEDPIKFFSVFSVFFSNNQMKASYKNARF